MPRCRAVVLPLPLFRTIPSQPGGCIDPLRVFSREKKSTSPNRESSAMRFRRVWRDPPFREAKVEIYVNNDKNIKVDDRLVSYVRDEATRFLLGTRTD